MSADFLHNHPQFPELIRIVAQQRGIDPALVEKDYWIMHCLYGLQKLNMKFEQKGGTSLSKGYKIISRFSEDIDIRVEPPAERQLATRKNQISATQVKSRKTFYDWLATTIKIALRRSHAMLPTTIRTISAAGYGSRTKGSTNCHLD